MSDKIQLFATCSSGLEDVLMEELRELGYDDLTSSFRGVYIFTKKIEDIYRINYCSRIAGRVLFPLRKFKIRRTEDLYNEVLQIQWDKYFTKPNYTLAIDANVSNPLFKNSLYAAQVTKDAICDQLRQKFGFRPSVNTENPTIQLNLFIYNNQAVLSFDTSGTPLFKRGYRIETVAAPIQESLAAALLRMAKYQGTEILCDPCCGSGTFLIEALMIASKIPAGFYRTNWGFYHLPFFSSSAWAKIKVAEDSKRISLPPGHFLGIDQNKNAVRIAKTNLRAAGFLKEVEILQGNFANVELPFNPNFVITNPPHGIRLDEVDSLKPLYRALGDFFKRKMEKPGKAFIFTGSLDLSKEVGLAADKRNVIKNSNIESRFLEFTIY
ncbi:Ribosomal RNA large subunit methyltransferase L [Candidatus Rubidus massiliensis]|nr:Ribosomal RNA large subunit methyltransferase L [Candidatus Rubidus massiliensis]